MGSIKRNFGYNLILTIANYIFPVITYPYITRVLGVGNIGACNYVDSIINYFVLFSTLGVGSLGVREIARCKDNKTERISVFSNLLLFNMVMTLLSITILVICTYSFQALYPYKKFLLIGIIKLLFTPLTIEWFYQGIQIFRYITIRTILIRILYIIALFLFVHNESDVYIYYILTTITIILNAIWNLFYSRHFVKLSFKGIKLKLFIMPIMIFGYYRILTSLYTTFNTFYLGMTSGDVEVGYFTTATKINAIIMSVFTAFTTVMVPKVAEMLHEGKKEELKIIADKTFSVLTTLALPIIVLCFFCAEQIIRIIAGNGFEGAVPAFRIVVVLILIIGIEQIVIQQFLMASKNNKTIFIVSSVGAVIGLSVNFILTPTFGSIGSSIAWAFSELGVMITGLVLLKRTMNLTLSILTLKNNILWSLSYVIPLYLISTYIENLVCNISISIISVLLLFFVINCYFNPQKLIVDAMCRLYQRITNKQTL